MKWAIRVGTIFGVEFRIHITFFILLFFIYIAGMREGPNQAINAVLFISAVFASVLIHEIGHSLIASRFGKETKSITLLPIGGVATIEEMPEKPVQEIAMSAIGPFINLAIAGILILLVGNWKGLNVPSIFPKSDSEFLQSLININIILAIFNLLPAFPMDGGRILRGILGLKLDFVRATSIAVFIGQAFSLFFIFYGIFFNLWLAIIGVFLYLGAGGEKHQIMMRNVLKNVRVSDITSKNYQTLEPSEPLSKALEKVYHGCQDDFPVVDKGEIKGILDRGSILAAIHERDVNVSVSEVMDTNFIYTEPEKPLTEIYKKLLAKNKSSMAVIKDGKLIGMLDLAGISRYFMIKSALQKKGN